mmetsp:Transcript_11037/g.23395  ORF Transcript_11037/g.23395 Transcript_11037/m.23395 type:complete len:344 (-) Transcript_11037:194-1225(-)
MLRAEENEREQPKVRLSTFCNESDLRDASNGNSNSTTNSSFKSNGSGGRNSSQKSRSTRRGGKRRSHRNIDQQDHQLEQEQQEEESNYPKGTFEHQGQSLFRRMSTSSGSKNVNGSTTATTEKTKSQQDAHAHHNAEEAHSKNGKKQHERQKKLGNRTSCETATASKTALTSLQVAMLSLPPNGTNKKSKTTIGDHLKTSSTSTTTSGNINSNLHRNNSLDSSNKSGRTSFHEENIYEADDGGEQKKQNRKTKNGLQQHPGYELQPDLGTNPTLSTLSSSSTDKRNKTKKWWQRPSFHHKKKKKKKQQRSTSDKKIGNVSGHSSCDDQQQQKPATRNRRRSWG